MASRHIQKIWHHLRALPFRLPPNRATNISGGSNLEVFKFGMYIMFPIGWMYYFGTNLDTRFSVPDFWPEPGTTHKIPFEREELKEMSERLKAQRLERRRKRLEQARAEMRETGQSETPQVDGKVEDIKHEGQAAADNRSYTLGSIGKWFQGK